MRFTEIQALGRWDPISLDPYCTPSLQLELKQEMFKRKLKQALFDTPSVLPQATLVSKSKGDLCLHSALVNHFLLEAPDLHVVTLG